MSGQKSSFLVEEAEIFFDSLGPRNIQFVSPQIERGRTHFTLLAGANGTSKSRILAKLVEELTKIWANARETKSSPLGSSAHGLSCRSITVVANDIDHKLIPSEQYQGADWGAYLPARILVLSNLVMDKFHFVRDVDVTAPFYHYLGVRQASNLMTTGSTERSVSEAILKMMAEPERLTDFDRWIDLVFNRKVDICLGFAALRLKKYEMLMGANVPEDFVREVLSEKRRGIEEFDIKILTKQLLEIAEVVIPLANIELRLGSNSKRRAKFLLMNFLDEKQKKRLSEVATLFSLAARVDFPIWPEPYFDSINLLPFRQLSSGEQNLLSVGAKLIAHAMPGSLIVIDEPEVSLNVVWQQQYMALIEQSLKHAPGSHVLIATHSPHLIASLPRGAATVVLAKRDGKNLKFVTHDATFQGWGSESVLYRVLDIPSASTFHLNREIAKVLRHVQDGGKDKAMINEFLHTMSRLNFEGIKPLELVVEEVRKYLETL